MAGFPLGPLQKSFNISFNIALLLNAYMELTPVRNDDEQPSLSLRLPQTIVPQSYDIKIIPLLGEKNFIFKGEVSIWVYAKEETKNITLHASNLTIDNTSLSVEHLNENNKSEKVEITGYEVNTLKDFLIIHFKESIKEKQNYKIHITYEGIQGDNLRGFYRVQYTENNESKWVVATHFGPTNARLAFPCFDEPAFKATFKISLARPKNMSSLSNMPKEGSSEPVDGLSNYVWDHYQESPLMSTYLICFVISDFANLTSGNFSVWARREVISQAKYVLSIAPKIMKFYEDYFQTDYSLPKMDMIAFPEFSTRAMENWGLIGFREAIFLYEEGVTQTLDLMMITLNVAHELAHQFFGNLVTLKWWSDLWLNEGLAEYVAYFGMNEINPEWRVQEIISRPTFYSLEKDAKNGTHKIHMDVEDTDKIRSNFDFINYFKSVAIIRMMEHFLTEPILRKGLILYIRMKKYGNSEESDLWTALTIVAHENKKLESNVTIKDIMETWTHNEGYPIITVTRNYTTNTVTFTQNRFFFDHVSEESPSSWWIPISFTTKHNPDFNDTVPKLWIEKFPTKTINLTAQRNEWLIVNLKQTGYYIVNYDLENWNMIIGQLQNSTGFEEIHVTNRMQIMFDLFAIAKAGISNYTLALEASKYLVHEQNFLPWDSAIDSFLLIDKFLRNTQYQDKFRQFLVHLLNPIYNKNGFEGSSNDHSFLFEIIRGNACSFGIKDCIEKCFHKFLTWKNMLNPDQNNPINAKLRKLIYYVIAKHGTNEDWEFLWQRYIRNKSGKEDSIFIQAMASSENHNTLNNFLDRSLTLKTNVSEKNAIQIFQSVGENPVGEELGFIYLKNNWSRLVDLVGNNTELYAKFLHAATSSMQTEDQLSKVKEFVISVNISEEQVKKLYNVIKKNIELRNRHLESLIEFVSTLSF